MRTLMVTDGTLGSVRVMVALGCGLVKRGHKPVLVACPSRFRALVEDYGLRWTPFNPAPLPCRDFRVFARELEEVCRREGIDQTRDSTATQQRTCIVCEHSSLNAAYSLAEKFAVCWVGVFFAPVSPTDTHPSTAFTACPAASSSSSSPSSNPTALRLTTRGVAPPHRGWMNKWTHLLALALEWRWGEGGLVNEWREGKLQLPAIPNAFGVAPLIKKQTLPIIYPLHPAFFAKPLDWPSELKVPAFIFLPDKPAPAPFLSSDLRLELAANKETSSSQTIPAEEQPSWEKKEDESAKEEEQRLERFFRSEEGTGRKPVFFACGGMVDGPASARSLLSLATQLAGKTQRQVVLFIRDEDGPAKRLPQEEKAASSSPSVGNEGNDEQSVAEYSADGDGVADVHPAWTEVIYASGAIPESLCVISRLNYASILPKCGCAILDGGHAITAASIRAGVPLVSVPSDDRVSWFWANRAYEVAVSPRPIARSELNVDILVQAIDGATSVRTAEKLQELSKKVNADGDGVRKVVDAFERVCITSIGLVPTSDYADMSTVSALAQELSLKEMGTALGFVATLVFVAWVLLKLFLV